MKTIKIAIIDIIGLNYDGTTLEKRGIGGSESAVISMSRELCKLGFEVTVFNDCEGKAEIPGRYDGVDYFPVRTLAEESFDFDIVISQRTVVPFVPANMYDQVKHPAPRNYDHQMFAQVQKPSQLKIVWMHDAFVWGDEVLETLLNNKNIDEVFVLSDWHASYTSHAVHGPRRNFEVLKDKLFLTRNGINRWIDWVDVKQKDPNLFVYNASISKGMRPLVTKIWPKVRAQIPQAKLIIIGGYYQFRNEPVSDAVKEVIALQESVKHDPSITFTGVIPQPAIAEIMAKASFNIYPGAYPETSGISVLESINYNTPVIGTRFGAMAETATEEASYFIDYAIEPNGLFPNINSDRQIEKFVDLVVRAHADRYLHQQKQNACNIVKEVSTWDTIALQWMQHFYNKLDIDLPKTLQDKVDWINYRVRKIFGRKFTNAEDIVVPEVTADLYRLPTKPVSLAIVDIVGIAYDGDTLNRKGLGGSESAVILVSRELVKIGFNVTVFNACDVDGASPGTYDNVQYRPLSEIATCTETFDIVISSRSVTPFIPAHRYQYPQNSARYVPYQAFESMRANAKLKVFWMHDTFSWGDEVLEELVTEGSVDEIWTLSDFHAMYVMNCSHPTMRNFEVLRNHMWTTRNGIVKYFDADIDSKDPNLFIFNANSSKGLAPLLNSIWPQVSARLPEARLKVIGGFYKLGTASVNDNPENEFEKIVGPHRNNTTIEFTGIVSQREVAEITAKASYFIYPAALPETYGISTLESLYYNTPLLTCKFGALEETASEHSYYIDYPVVPNGLFPNINSDKQTHKFVDMVCDAFADKDEHSRRMQSLNSIKELAGWDVVALEWKQHLYSNLGLYISRGETQKALYTRAKYHQLFNRRLSVSEEAVAPKLIPEKKIVIISPFYNAKDYIEKCIISVAAQNYTNYEHWLIDDASTDNSATVASTVIESLPDDVRHHFKLVCNTHNVGAVANHISSIRKCNDDDIVLLLDGDDSLVNRPDIFDYYNYLHDKYDFTYGSCWSVVDNIPLVGQPYPPDVRECRSYKTHKFVWNMPYTHLRSLKAKLLKYEPDYMFCNSDGEWFRAGGDNSTFYTAIENCDSTRVYAVSDIVYNYNDASPLNDYKVNKEEQDKTVSQILGTHIQTKKMKRILIAIPTNRNIEAQTFKSIYDLIIPDGYQVEFQYFWGYQVEQVRNLIADWVIRHGYDYLFAVDSDMAFAPDTLVKLLSADKDIVSGLYIQRIPGTHTLEIMRKNQWGGVSAVDYADIKDQGLVPIDACGFGCVLVKSHVFKGIPYPHFVYKSAIDHANTVSEDVYFCEQARGYGFTLWADTSVICDHIGSFTFKVDTSMTAASRDTPLQARLRAISSMDLLPEDHKNYLVKLKEKGINPKTIYDVGASTLHWTNVAEKVWPESKIYAFDAQQSCEFLYKEKGMPYCIAVFSNEIGKEVTFYRNDENPAGNSYYRENETFSPAAKVLYDDSHAETVRTVTLDAVAEHFKFESPDLIKLDIQGAELDVIRGSSELLKTCNSLIVELQHVEYNVGAPMAQEVIDYLDQIGFKLVDKFSENSEQADYYFEKYK